MRILAFKCSFYLIAVFFALMSLGEGWTLAEASEWEPLRFKSLFFSGKYEENGISYNNRLSINGKVLELITLKNGKLFGILVPNEIDDCSQNCGFKVHFGDKDINLPSETQAKIRWWSSKDCVWSRHGKCEIYEQKNGFIIDLKKYELFYDIKKLIYTKNKFDNRNYKNTNFYEMHYERGFFKNHYLRSNFKNSRTVVELMLTTKDS